MRIPEEYLNIGTLIFAGFLMVAGGGLSGAELRSNGRGGGLWTAPESWHGNEVPTMNDNVSIVEGDTVEFNGKFVNTPACLKLRVQAKGALNFKADGGQYILSLAGALEVYGSVSMPGRLSPEGSMELWLVAQKEEERFIHIYSNSSFTALGASGLPDGRRNVIICTGAPQPRQPRLKATIIADAGSRYSFHNAAFSHSSEYHSNGAGGGLWENPATWRGSIVPSLADLVVIAAGDTVFFDGNDTDKATCRKIVVDPGGTLAFKADGAEHVLRVAGPVELFGRLLMNAARSPETIMELRLAAEEAEQQKIRLFQNAALLAYGARGLAENRRNVIISAGAFEQGYPSHIAFIEANVDTMLDLHHARLIDVVVSATSIDNTSFKPGERLNIIGNHFSGASRLALADCDTARVCENLFEYTRMDVLDNAAIYAVRCKLAEIKDNRITGRYRIGIRTHEDVDSSAIGNTISGADYNVYWHGQNAMIKKNNMEECQLGVFMDSVTGTMEDTSVKSAATALDLRKSNVQLINFKIDDLPTNNVAMKVEESTVTLLNCNIEPPQIKPVGNPSTIQSMEYLVVKVTGKRPPGTFVQVVTAADSGGPPARGADLNVRNSPAALTENGLTPLPYTLMPLIVRSWKLEHGSGHKVNAPFYDLIVSAPGAEEGKPPTVLKKQIIEPKKTWFRHEPDRPTATLEVVLP